MMALTAFDLRWKLEMMTLEKHTVPSVQPHLGCWSLGTAQKPGKRLPPNHESAGPMGNFKSQGTAGQPSNGGGLVCLSPFVPPFSIVTIATWSPMVMTSTSAPMKTFDGGMETDGAHQCLARGKHNAT